MQGHGYAPPPREDRRRPSDGTLVTLRVIFAVATFLTCGALAWAALLRLAIVTRSRLNWILFGVAILLDAGLFAFMVATGDSEELTDGQAVTLIIGLLTLVCGGITYYLVADIRHYERSAPGYQRYSALPVPQPPRTPPGFGYGYPPAAAPVDPVVPAQPPAAHQPPRSPGGLDQVRAELDELSDILRKGKGPEDR
ncbi:hypothetical protein [Streptomyces sp. AK02-01A]|uniref:hypothetical protein n=1 Tax=Streptomyces sp. AK02-01A TaxID=3028648 RepID=UPI0029AEDE3B|nr:hypothetical protein [Streptomyces sp. AK02-01A]MDX3851380.1 hypothetical protein [Streptomyces sp. AK02-01A]